MDLICPDCHNTVHEGARFCEHCARPLFGDRAPERSSSPSGAGQIDLMAPTVGTPLTELALVVQPRLLSLTVGGSDRLAVQAHGSPGSMALRGGVVWESTNPRAIEVSPDGSVRAIRPGFADVVVRAGELQDSCRVTVHSRPVPSLRIVDPPSTLSIGEQVELRAEVFTRGGKAITGREIRWRSVAPKIASITPEGVLIARAAGRAIVCAFSEGRSRTFQVEIRPLPIASLAVEPSSLSVRAGKREQLRVRALDAANQPVEGHLVTWSVDDPRIVEVDDRGIVTGESPGHATVHVACDGKMVSIPVTVAKDPYAALRGKGAQRVAAGVGVGAIALAASLFLIRQPSAVAPPPVANAPPKDTAQVQTPVVAAPPTASVPVGPSPVTLPPRTTDSPRAATPPPTTPVRPVVALRPRSISIEIGTSDTVVATEVVGGASRPATGRVVWSVADTTIASITGDGIVTGRAAGTTRLVAQIDSTTASAPVRVAAAAIDSIAVFPSATRVKVRDSVRVEARGFDRRRQAVSQAALEWTSSRSDVAKVDDRGTVAGVAVGTAEITVKSGQVTATVAVTVEDVAETPVSTAPAPLTTERMDALLQPLLSALNRGDTDAVGRLYRAGVDDAQRRRFFAFLASKPRARLADTDRPTTGEGDQRRLEFTLIFNSRVGNSEAESRAPSVATFTWNGTEWVFGDFWMVTQR